MKGGNFREGGRERGGLLVALPLELGGPLAELLADAARHAAVKVDLPTPRRADDDDGEGPPVRGVAQDLHLVCADDLVAQAPSSPREVRDHVAHVPLVERVVGGHPHESSGTRLGVGEMKGRAATNAILQSRGLERGHTIGLEEPLHRRLRRRETRVGALVLAAAPREPHEGHGHEGPRDPLS